MAGLFSCSVWQNTLCCYWAPAAHYPPHMENKILQFRKDYPETKNVVFCIKCGSTDVDQNYRNQLLCNHCGNFSIWDSSRFSIACDGKEHDVVSALRAPIEAKSADSGDWSAALVSSLFPLGHAVADMRMILSGGLPGIRSEDYVKLIAIWDDTKTRIDAAIESLRDRSVGTADQ